MKPISIDELRCKARLGTLTQAEVDLLAAMMAKDLGIDKTAN